MKTAGQPSVGSQQGKTATCSEFNNDSDVKPYPEGDLKFIFYTFKQSFVALAFLRLISEKIGGHGTDDVIVAAVAALIGMLLRFKTTRKILPKKILALWEPLRRIRRTRNLKLKASILIDVMSYAAFFYPAIIKLIFGKSGWVPIGVFLVQYLYTRWSLMLINFMEIFTPTNFIPTATLGWLEENKFIEQKDLWKCLVEPSHAKQIVKKMFKRAKEYRKEGKQSEVADAADEVAHAVAQEVKAAQAAGGYVPPASAPHATAPPHKETLGSKMGTLLGKAVDYAEDLGKKTH